MSTIRQHIDRLRNAENVAQDVARALYRAGQKIEATAKKSITDGAVSGAGHVPSLPGQPPNEDTGGLRRSGETRIVASGDAPLVEVVFGGPSAPYATHLEFGTSKMAARPYLKPATEKHRAEIIKEVSAAVSIAIKRG